MTGNAVMAQHTTMPRIAEFGAVEDSNTYCQSGVTDGVAAHTCGSEAKANAAYCHGSAAKEDAAYGRGGAAKNNATSMPKILVILK
jgi:hypothetical protein